MIEKAIPNKLEWTLSKDEISRLPVVQPTTMAIFARHVPEIGSEKLDIQFTAKNIADNEKAILNATENLANAERKRKALKIIAISLLAVTVAALATVILLATFTSPLFWGFILFPSIPLVISGVLFEEASNATPPTEAEYLAQIKADRQTLENDEKRLFWIRENAGLIMAAIHMELGTINLCNYNQNLDTYRILKLHEALKTLDQLQNA